MIIYECGICDQHHPWDWDGDCREDANRFMPDDYATRLGVDESELDIRSWEDRVDADEGEWRKAKSQETRKEGRCLTT